MSEQILSLKMNQSAEIAAMQSGLDMKKIEQDFLAAPLVCGGNYGILAWDTDFHVDFADVAKSYASVWLKVLGCEVLNGRLDKDHPSLKADLTVAGAGVKLEVGIDFNSRKVYLRGKVGYFFGSKDYNLTILNF